MRLVHPTHLATAEITNKRLPVSVEKSLIVIGGANGSGKSTLGNELELNFAFAHLDPDRIVMAGRQSAAGREAIALRKREGDRHVL